MRRSLLLMVALLPVLAAAPFVPSSRTGPAAPAPKADTVASRCRCDRQHPGRSVQPARRRPQISATAAGPAAAAPNYRDIQRAIATSVQDRPVRRRHASMPSWSIGKNDPRHLGGRAPDAAQLDGAGRLQGSREGTVKEQVKLLAGTADRPRRDGAGAAAIDSLYRARGYYSAVDQGQAVTALDGRRSDRHLRHAARASGSPSARSTIEGTEGFSDRCDIVKHMATSPKASGGGRRARTTTKCSTATCASGCPRGTAARVHRLPGGGRFAHVGLDHRQGHAPPRPWTRGSSTPWARSRSSATGGSRPRS